MLRKLVIISIFLAVFNAEACPNDKWCESCSGSKCLACHDSYSDSAGVCKEPDTKIDNCEHYTNATTCAACDEGYDLASNKCVKIDIANCIALNPIDKTQCIACDNGKQVASGKCDGDKACSTENCKYCVLDICGMCKSGYSLDATFKCVKEPVSGCAFVGTDAATCDLCSHGYYDAGTECKKNAKIFGIIALFISALIMV